jgi:hypothetical protein
LNISVNHLVCMSIVRRKIQFTARLLHELFELSLSKGRLGSKSNIEDSMAFNKLEGSTSPLATVFQWLGYLQTLAWLLSPLWKYRRKIRFEILLIALVIRLTYLAYKMLFSAVARREMRPINLLRAHLPRKGKPTMFEFPFTIRSYTRELLLSK